jgi:hypothetical protein
MMSSSDKEELLLQLRKLHEESARLWVNFAERERNEQFVGNILEIQPEVLAVSKYEVAALVFNLETVSSFSFAGVEEATVPSEADKSFEYCLQLSWPSGARCRLYRVRADFDVTD